jgi:hypothetical protein
VVAALTAGTGADSVALAALAGRDIPPGRTSKQ